MPPVTAEEAPLLPGGGPQPTLVGDPAGPVPSSNSRFGVRAFLRDVQDSLNGTVPITLVIAATIGIFCGVAAAGYYELLHKLFETVWEDLPEQFFAPLVPKFLHWLWVPLVGMSCALLVGYSIALLGDPGDLRYTVQAVHDRGFIPVSHAPSMVAASAASIIGGGSLGPEAPLVAICAALGGWVSRTVFRQKYKNVVRKHTLCGMACATAAFFGVPLGGALFALEVNNRLGYEYFEHALAAIFSGTVCLAVFRYLTHQPIGPIWEIAPTRLPQSSPALVALGAALGLAGAAVAALFAHVHWALMGQLRRRDLLEDPVRLAAGAGAAICAIGLLVPHTFFWGEWELQTIAALEPVRQLPRMWPHGGLTGLEITGVGSALLVGFAKLLAISVTLAGGYRGGFIFPFFCAGSAFGRAIVFAFPGTSPVVAVLCLAAGINVSITRTTLATPLILCMLAGEPNAMPSVLAASLAATFATVYMPFITSQRGRDNIVESQLHSYTLQKMWESGDADDAVIEEDGVSVLPTTDGRAQSAADVGEMASEGLAAVQKGFKGLLQGVVGIFVAQEPAPLVS